MKTKHFNGHKIPTRNPKILSVKCIPKAYDRLEGEVSSTPTPRPYAQEGGLAVGRTWMHQNVKSQNENKHTTGQDTRAHAQKINVAARSWAGVLVLARRSQLTMSNPPDG